jgi:preprotein translocase subunit SecG
MHVLTILLTIVEVTVCLLLIGLVLIQRSKGEGISSAFGGGMGESIFGANVGNVVTRTTVVLGIVFLLNTICLTLLMTKTRGRGTGSVMDDMARQPVTREAPAAPAPGGLPAPVLPAPTAP